MYICSVYIICEMVGICLGGIRMLCLWFKRFRVVGVHLFSVCTCVYFIGWSYGILIVDLHTTYCQLFFIKTQKIGVVCGLAFQFGK